MAFIIELTSLIKMDLTSLFKMSFKKQPSVLRAVTSGKNISLRHSLQSPLKRSKHVYYQIWEEKIQERGRTGKIKMMRKKHTSSQSSSHLATLHTANSKTGLPGLSIVLPYHSLESSMGPLSPASSASSMAFLRSSIALRIFFRGPISIFISKRFASSSSIRASRSICN